MILIYIDTECILTTVIQMYQTSNLDSTLLTMHSLTDDYFFFFVNLFNFLVTDKVSFDNV